MHFMSLSSQVSFEIMKKKGKIFEKFTKINTTGEALSKKECF